MWAMMEKLRVSSVDMGGKKVGGAARESRKWRTRHEKSWAGSVHVAVVCNRHVQNHRMEWHGG
jgi:hypothetical protein